MNQIMPAESGDTKPTEQMYPITEAAELLLHQSRLGHRYTAVEAKRALRAAAVAGEVPSLWIDNRMAFAHSDIESYQAVQAIAVRLLGGEPR